MVMVIIPTSAVQVRQTPEEAVLQGIYLFTNQVKHNEGEGEREKGGNLSYINRW